MTIQILGVTANCGNDLIGQKTLAQLVNLLEHQADLMVFNCQEVQFKKQIEQFKQAISAKNIDLAHSNLKVTRTKPSLDVLLGHTGIATFVLYNTDIIKNAHFSKSEKKEVHGKNINKGGLLNSLIITKKDGMKHRIRTLSGHLDSQSLVKRVGDWQSLKKKSFFKTKTWSELVEKVPEAQISGYDANTRNVWDPSFKKPSRNLWNESTLDSRIASIALAPAGLSLYSADNTYKTSKETIGPDTKRPGYAMAGSLDFVAIQNNSESPVDLDENNKHYSECLLNLQEESNTKRDHNVIVSYPFKLKPICAFSRVQNYVFSELKQAAPKLADEVLQLPQNESSKQILLMVQQAFLSPDGKLANHIQLKEIQDANISPWFAERSINSVMLEQLKSLKQQISDKFRPKRLFFTKSKYKSPLSTFLNAYRDYLDGKNEQSLLTSLEGLKSVTNDLAKKSLLKRFKQVVHLMQFNDNLHNKKKNEIYRKRQQIGPTVK